MQRSHTGVESPSWKRTVPSLSTTTGGPAAMVELPQPQIPAAVLSTPRSSRSLSGGHNDTTDDECGSGGDSGGVAVWVQTPVPEGELLVFKLDFDTNELSFRVPRTSQGGCQVLPKPMRTKAAVAAGPRHQQHAAAWRVMVSLKYSCSVELGTLPDGSDLEF